jgi:hypothetical protein
LALVLLAVPTILATAALPAYLAGRELSFAGPVLSARLYGKSVDRPGLESAEGHLAMASASGGEATAWHAEVLALLAGSNPQALALARDEVLTGISKAPANPRAWALLCELAVKLGRSDAPDCLSTALDIGPFDWFTARRKAMLTAYLWRKLDSSTQETAAHQLWTIWGARVDHSDPLMRSIVFDVDHEADGPLLLADAFKDDRAGLRDLNRWLMNTVIFGEPPSPYGPP